MQETYLHKMFIATVSAVAKLWNQPKHPTANEWIKQCDIYIYKKAYYSAIMKNKITKFARKQVELKITKLSEIIQA
jgi:hypothetical protein